MTRTPGRRLLVVVKGSQTIPSVAVRGLIYREMFAARGVEVDYFNLNSESLIGRLERPEERRYLPNSGLVLLNSLVRAINERRLAWIAPRYDVVYLLKCGSADICSRLRRSATPRIVCDLNDAQWLPFRRRDGQEEQLQALLRSADCVTCDNRYTAAYARRFNECVRIVPDPSQVEMFDQVRGSIAKPADRVTLGWIGSPETARNLYAIWEVLEELFSRHANLELRLVGVGHDRRLWPPFERVRYSIVPRYSRQEMIREVLRMHVGLFPASRWRTRSSEGSSRPPCI